MHGKLMPLPFLVAFGASWLIGLWLAIVPAQSNASLIRVLRLDSIAYVGVALRIVGAAWVLLLTVGLWLNFRPYAGR
jgi:hypothetical protein